MKSIIDKRTIRSLKVGNYYGLTSSLKLRFSKEKTLYCYWEITKRNIKEFKKLL